MRMVTSWKDSKVNVRTNWSIVVFLLIFTICNLSSVLAKPVKLRILIGGDNGGWKKVVERFHKEYPDIRIELISGPATTDIRENMYTVSFIAKRRTYDLVFMDIVWVAKFAAAGWLEPLDEYIKEAGINLSEEFFPGDIEGSTYNGKLYRIPIQSDVGLLYYRKDWLEECGYTERDIRTWQDVKRIGLEVARHQRSKLLARGEDSEIYGLVFQGKQYEGLVCCFMEFLRAFGGEVERGGKVVLDSPNTIAALKFMRSLLADGVVSKAITTYEEEEARNIFEMNRAVFMRNWPYVAIGWANRNSPFLQKAGVTMIPGAEFNGKFYPSSPTLGGWGLGISVFSEHKREAWKFIEFVLRDENLKILYKVNGMLPSRRKLYSDPELVSRNLFMNKFAQALELAKPRPKHPTYARISDLIQFYVSSVLIGRMNPEEAVPSLSRSLSRIY